MTTMTRRRQSIAAGLMILLAYSMLTYTATGHILIGVLTDILSGLSVIGIALIFYPIFRQSLGDALLNKAYLISRLVEGGLMILGGFVLLSQDFEPYRNLIYENIHIHFFNLGALFFYFLLYRTNLVPNFLSLWGLFATILLIIRTTGDIVGSPLPFAFVLVLPVILNELVLAIWLMIKGIHMEVEQ